jgi:predicted dehydrogenase
VFTEKPLCANLAEAELISKIAKKSGRLLHVGYLFRFAPAIDFLKGNVDNIDPYYAIFRLGGRGNHKVWKHLKETGGGAVNEMLCHMLDLVQWFFGDYEVRAYLKDIILKERKIQGETFEPDAEDFAIVDILTDSGVKVICQSDLATPTYMNHIEIHGHKGSLLSSISGHIPATIYDAESKSKYVVCLESADFVWKELEYFIDRIKSGSTNLFSLEDSIKIMKIMENLK